jgi:hypothetical protein
MKPKYTLKFISRLAEVLTIVPVAIWIVHIALASFNVFDLVGCDKFDFFVRFFVTSSIIMMINSISCLYIVAKKNCPQHKIAYIALLLNSSWIYYVKVVMFGPTIGNL